MSNYRVDASGTVHLLGIADNNIAANSFPNSNLLTNPSDVTAIGLTYPSAWANYSIPLSLTNPTIIDLSNINTANIPNLGTGNNAFSGRIYISLGVPTLPFTVLAANTISPNPFAGPSLVAGTPGALCLFDWFEFSIDSNGILNGNTTQVDQFGFPLTITATPGGPAQGALNVTRTALMNDVANFPAPFTNVLTVPVTVAAAYPTGTNFLRAFSPDHMSGAGSVNTPFDTYFDTLINVSYSTWATTPLVVTDTATGTYTGMVVGGNNLVFLSGNLDATTWASQFPTASSPITFGQITTAQIWQCSGPLATGSAAQLNIGKQILAAFNRGVIANTLNDGSCPTDPAATYYQAAPFNVWAENFHIWNSNHFAYGFAYDDVCSQNPTVQSTATLQSATITLGEFF